MHLTWSFDVPKDQERILFLDKERFCLCWGFTAHSTQWCHVKRIFLPNHTLTGQFLSSIHVVDQYCALPFPETDNCPSWISRRERMTVENISWSISMKKCCRSGRCRTRNCLITSRTHIQLSHRGWGNKERYSVLYFTVNIGSLNPLPTIFVLEFEHIPFTSFGINGLTASICKINLDPLSSLTGSTLFAQASLLKFLWSTV